ncbi:hypothetical protein PR003_g5039 [Phytophthora rubi]|uniref:Uncharacterized protein n=1 Tax=Phytophthora rubi TaxID=129364 RepID=A0A6A4FKN8_9STRA|nr:hypothetical protein PR002_g7701 [Phytophthora rubi]KAE9041843.1 hypothetical protein PR001_g6448 [Phytophthora rubi]KAE9351121.1 hypothetical protein PR003_g5039 [Phytophthora rubi]
MDAGSSPELPISEINFESYMGRRYTVEMPNTHDATLGPAYDAPDKEPIDGDEMTL